MIKIKILLIAIIFITPKAYSQSDTVVSKIIEISKTDNKTMQHLDILCNRFGGRLIGSDAYENAGIWAASKFKEWGMQVEIDEAGELPVGFNRGPWFGKLLAENGMSLHFATPSYSSGTKGVQRGHVLKEPKTQAQFDRMKKELNGAWVLVTGESSGWPIDYSENGDKIRDSIKIVNEEIEKKNNEIRSYNWQHRKTEDKKELLPYHSHPAVFYKEMKEAGILGIIQSAPIPIVALYDRNNLYDMTFETLPTIPDIKLDEHQYKIIEQMAEERQYFQLEFDIRNHFKLGPVKYHNIIGIIPGTEFPDEYVIVSGHLDAYDVATGGVDDGSGVSPTLEAARLIMAAGGQPKRTMLFCLWAGEEFGLLGAQSWIDRNKDKMDKISNVINRDGGPTVADGISVTDAMRNDIEKICEPINSINTDFPFEIDERKPRELPAETGGNDASCFAVEGVPIMNFKTSDSKGYNFSYMEIWHTERDMFNKSIAEYQEHTSIVTAIVAYGIANLDHLLSRDGYYTISKESKKKK